MNILSLNVNGHDASAVIFQNGQIKDYLAAERVASQPHDSVWNKIVPYLTLKKFDKVLVNVFRYTQKSFFEHTFTSHFDTFQIKYDKIVFNYTDHHIHHAYCGFFNSPFKEALCVVIDGLGAEKVEGSAHKYEIESVYLANRKTLKEISKKYHDSKWNKRGFCINPEGPFSPAKKFQNLSEEFGWGPYGADRIMDLARYKGHESKVKEEWKDKIDKSYKLQKETEEEVIEVIRKHSEENGMTNIVLSGGYFLNCVANSRIKKEFPELNFFIDPLCSNIGIAIGQAYKFHKENAFIKRIKPLECSYIGSPLYVSGNRVITLETSYEKVAELLTQGKVIGIGQGRSEPGNVSLGNRSVLMDPRIADGRKKLNQMLKRDEFGSIGATILSEYVNEWFGEIESPYMQYVADLKKKGVPVITNVDNACKVHTLYKEQNKHFYNLLKSFYELTGVPILANVPFTNKVGVTAESMDQMLNYGQLLNIEYIFFPETMALLRLANCPPSRKIT